MPELLLRFQHLGGRVAALRLPQFNGISFRIVQSREPTIWVTLGIHLHCNCGCAQLGHHGVETAHPKIHHLTILAVAKVVSILRKRCKRSCATLLLPWCLSIAGWDFHYAKVFLIPITQSRGIPCAKE